MEFDQWVRTVFEPHIAANPTLFFANAGRAQLERFRSLGLDKLTVASEHRSKSVILPVVRGQIGDAVITARDNFYDVKVSVESPHPVVMDIDDLLARGNDAHDLNSVYFEGFRASWVFPRYMRGTTRFSVAIYKDEDIDVLFAKLRAALEGEKK